MDDRCMMVLFLIILHVFHGNVVFARELELVKLQGLMFYQYVLKRKNMCVMPRVAPDIRPAGYTAFFNIQYPAGYPVSFVGYPVGRISGQKNFTWYILSSKPKSPLNITIKFRKM